MSEFNVQDFANTAWAFATLSQLSQQVFAALAPEAEPRMSKFTVQTVNHLHEKLFAALATPARGR